MRISFPGFVAAPLMVIYSSGASVVPKGKIRQIKSGLPTITMHVEVICMFSWMRRYAASRSVFLIRIRSEGNLMHMDAIMWSILRRQKPHKHG